MPQLTEMYDDAVVSLTPDVDTEILQVLDEMPLRYEVTSEWGQGRYLCLAKALETPADYIHYVDTDRLIRWVELRPEELKQTIAAIQRADYTVIGRTDEAWQTHPHALYETEKVINDLFSYLLAMRLDFGAGSKGFSRRAAEFVVEHGAMDTGLGADTEWSVLLHRAGFTLADLRVDGLDWESADQYCDSAAGAETQRRAAEKYDLDAAHWAFRVEVAQKMAEAGLDALKRRLDGKRGA